MLLAFADSINPCTFAVFTALLLISLHMLGKIRTALTGISFILAVYICYYMLGLGLIRSLTRIPYTDKIVPIIGFIIGGKSVVSSLKQEFKSSVPKIFRKYIEKCLEKAYLSPTASFMLGVLASFTLLPCSGGPYVVGLGLLSILKEKLHAYLLLALYNIIFVMPLLVILLMMLISQKYMRNLKKIQRKTAQSDGAHKRATPNNILPNHAVHRSLKTDQPMKISRISERKRASVHLKSRHDKFQLNQRQDSIMIKRRARSNFKNVESSYNPALDHGDYCWFLNAS